MQSLCSAQQCLPGAEASLTWILDILTFISAAPLKLCQVFFYVCVEK